MELKESYRNKRVGIKTDCHKLIDEMVRLGADRTTIYRFLSRKLGMPVHRTHFAQINDKATLSRAFFILDAQARGWRAKARKPRKRVQPAPAPKPPRVGILTRLWRLLFMR